MKILVIPDIHQTEHYKKVLDEHFDSVDKVVFLGDYFDYHDDDGVVEADKAIENFVDIVKLARENSDKVHALMGNHDQEYITDDRTNTYQYRYEAEFGKVLRRNLDALKVAVKIGDWVFSHAGISGVFLYANGFADRDGNGNIVPFENAVELLNEKLQKDGADFLTFSPFDMSGYGDDKTSSPTWIRPNSLLQYAAYPKQVVGHTAIGKNQEEHAYYDFNGNKVIFTDTKLKNKPFVLDTEKEYDFYEIAKKGKEICHVLKIKVKKESEVSWSYKIVIDADEPVLYKSALSMSGLEKNELSEYIDAALQELSEVYDLRGNLPECEVE